MSDAWSAFPAAQSDPWAAFPQPAAVNQQDGAPGNVRAAVGAAQRPADRLATIQRFYPDARPYGTDNFIFTDPQTRRPTLYNPPGLDAGDALSVLPEVGEAVGGFIGGALALPPAVAGAAPTGGLSALALPAGVGLGAAAGRELVTLGASLFNGTRDTRSPGARVGDAATTAGVNAVSVPLADLAMRGVRAAMGPVGRAFGGGRGLATPEDFAQAGVRASAGDVTNNPGTQSLQASVAAMPTGARRMATFMEGQADDLGQAVSRTAESVGVPTTPGNAGAVIREGAGAAVERFTVRQGELYDQAFERIGADSRVSFPAVQALRDRIAGELAQAPRSAAARLQPVLTRIDNLLADAGEDGLAFGAMRNERTALGATIGRPAVSASQAETEGARYMRQLYGALTDDMTAHAQAAGGDAARALALADRYTRFNRTVNLPALERLQRQGTDEQIYNLLFPRSGRPDGQSLLRTLRNLTPDERSTLAATVLDRMGTPNPGSQAAEDFSVSTFLTNWNRLTQAGPAARRALFGAEDAELGRSLDRLVRVASSIRDTQRFTNWSNTGRAVGGMAALGAVGGAALSGDTGDFAKAVGLTLVAPAVGARLLTSSAFVNWLAGNAPRIAEEGTLRAGARSLARVGAANPEIRDAIEAYERAFVTTQPAR